MQQSGEAGSAASMPAFGGRFRVFLLERLQEFIASPARRTPDAAPAHACPPDELAELGHCGGSPARRDVRISGDGN